MVYKIKREGLWWPLNLRIHLFDSFEEYSENHNPKYYTTKDRFRIKNVEITSLVTAGERVFYDFILKSGDRQIRGHSKLEATPNLTDLIRVKEGDKVTIGGFYLDLNSALKENEKIFIRYLYLVKGDSKK